ncbi:MAG: uridine kinase family protein [Thermomicrobiales bacterium]
MTIETGPGEPLAGPWRVEPLDALPGMLGWDADASRERPWVIAVDGRSAGGKSTLAARLACQVPGAVVVHTDDIAWHHSFFDWSDLLVDGVLSPARSGVAVRYRPPGWETHGRAGAIEIPAGCPLLVVEGVGASRREVAPWIDRAIWVQSDFAEAKRRGLVRDGGTDEAVAFWDEWMGEEVPFLERDRPWERASVIACGTPELAHDPERELVVARGPIVPPMGPAVS